jgi:hypothetical protein
MNLDEFNALVSGLYADKDRVLALQGISLGCNGGTCPEDAPAHLRRAWEVAISWRREAEEYRAKKARAGKASVSSRVAAYGTAQPFRTMPEQCSNDVQSVSEPIHNPQSVLSLRLEQTDATQGETAPIGEEVLLELPCQKGKTYSITQSTLDRWKDSFQEIDPLPEAKRMRFWLEENPSRQKTQKGMGKFISCWLGNARDRLKSTRTQPLHPATQSSTKSQLVDDYLKSNPEHFAEVSDAS